MRLTRHLPLAAALLAVAAWLAWAAVARHRLTVALARYRAAGGTTDVADLLGPAVRPERNAALLYIAAYQALSTTVLSPSNNYKAHFPPVPPYPPAWLAMADAAVAADGRSLSLARAARARPGIDWRLEIPTPASGVGYPGWLCGDQLSGLLADAAVTDHLHRDDRGAFDRVSNGLAFADAVDRLRPSVVFMHISAAEDEADVLWALQTILPDVRIGDGSRSVARSTVVQLGRQLLDETALTCAFLAGVRGSQLFDVDAVAHVASRLHLLAPLGDLELARTADREARLLPAARAADLPAALALLGPTPPPSGRAWGFLYPAQPNPVPPRYGRVFTEQMGDYFAREFVRHFQIVAERRATAVLLALRLYHLDHGRYPATLAELVPAYLPAVPIDPTVGGGRPMGYVVLPRGWPTGADRVLVVWGLPPGGPPPSPPAAFSAADDVYRRPATQWRDAAGDHSSPRR